MEREWKEIKKYEEILFEFYEGIAKITINRPRWRNAFTPLTTWEISDALYYCREAKDVRVVVLTGAGDKAFCSGGDMNVKGRGGYVGKDGVPRLNVLDVQKQIRSLPKPVIAMVNGYAIGGGHVLHVVCDLSIASENAIFGQTGPKVGSFDAGFGSSYLARIVGQKKAREICIEALRQVGISNPEQRVDEYPHQLSGGMRQRAMIAMALASKPSILIADEPTTALDVTIQAQVLDILKDLQKKQNTSLMLITHDLSIVMNMADEIYVMYCGKIVERAKTRELFKNPLHPYTNGLLGSIARIDDDSKRFVQIPSSLPSPMHKPEGCYFHPRCAYATERCRQEMPPLEQLEGGRCIRCWNYKEIRYDKQ